MVLEFDNELLAILIRDSNISKCKTNQVKRDKWKKIAEDYCKVKGIALIEHKKLSRKWARLLKKRSRGQKDSRVTSGGPSNVGQDQENELVLSAAEAKAEPDTEANRERTEVDSLFQDVQDEEESQSLVQTTCKRDNDMETYLLEEQDPFLDVNKEVVSQDSKTPLEEEVEIDDEKFIRRVRKKIALRELEKVEVENFTAQLKRNMAIAEYNKALGKNIPLRPLVDM